jgi:hypothetical protein
MNPSTTITMMVPDNLIGAANNLEAEAIKVALTANSITAMMDLKQGSMRHSLQP